MNKIKLLDGRIDLAIVDIGLPDRDGGVLVTELRVVYPHLPIIIASGGDDGGLRHRFAADKLISMLRKPYARTDLEQAVADARRSRDAAE
jgi:DNA-binding NarL/FixJ family response regulator